MPAPVTVQTTLGRLNNPKNTACQRLETALVLKGKSFVLVTVPAVYYLFSADIRCALYSSIFVISVCVARHASGMLKAYTQPRIFLRRSKP